MKGFGIEHRQVDFEHGLVAHVGGVLTVGLGVRPEPVVTIILERPDLVKELVVKHGARDTTMRGNAMAELEAMTPRFSQWLPGEEIPEKHWMYRLAKKHWFGDFGAYHAEPPSDQKARALREQVVNKR